MVYTKKGQIARNNRKIQSLHMANMVLLHKVQTHNAHKQFAPKRAQVSPNIVTFVITVIVLMGAILGASL